MPRELQAFACGLAVATVAAFATLCLSYGKLVRNVEFAAGSAGVIDGRTGVST
jgi:hypothetical protein